MLIIIIVMSRQCGKYDMVAQYDTMEGMSQDDGTKVVNMFRYYEEEDTRYYYTCVIQALFATLNFKNYFSSPS